MTEAIENTSIKDAKAAVAKGFRNSAILLMTLAEDAAAEVMKLLPHHQQHQVSLEMSRLGSITHDELQKVLQEFMTAAEQNADINIVAGEHVRAILTKALGADRAAKVLDDITEDQQTSFGIDKLNLMDASTVADMIRDEHPQVITTILVHLDKAQIASILDLFDEKTRNDQIVRISTFNGVHPDVLADLTEMLNKMLDGQSLKRSKMGGIRATAEILNSMHTPHEESALGFVRTINADLAQKIEDEMLVFENLIQLDPRSVQRLMEDLDINKLAIALKGAPTELLEKFTDTMSKRGAELFMEDMKTSGPIRISQVETEQKNILLVVRRLAASGDIVMSGGDDDYV
ncbi:flagellar motor switch protein FliG (plasmid) [Pseudomonas silesiensis]|uniref:flagellar motor switch protein FliG n=1 Tax=Pseudomonas silesiensis TaxID=1853130 RepID=UPI0030D3D30A